MKRFTFDEIKFRELILYIANRSENDPLFGVVKLNKILYYSDFAAYRILGQPITGAEYQKFNEGPAPREMISQRRIMMDSGDVTIKRRPYFSGVQQSIIPVRRADTGMFTREELSIVDGAIEGMWHMTPRAASAFSQQELGWLAAEHGETIPYETAWLSPGPVSQEGEEYAHKVVERLGRA